MQHAALRILTVLLVAAPLPLSAQARALPIAPGHRLRVEAPSLGESRRVGEFAGIHDQALLLMVDPISTPTPIPLNHIQVLEVSGGVDRSKGAIRGALLGLGAGVAGGFLCLAVCTGGEGANLAPIGGILLGFFVGVPLGGILGATALAPEDWEPLDLEKW